MNRWLRILILAAGLAPVAGGAIGCSKNEKSYYAVELNGMLVGYTEVDTTAGNPDSGEPAVHETDTVIRLSLLDKGVDMQLQERMERDPATGELTFYDADVTTGDMKVGSTVLIDGREVEYRPKGGGLERRMTVEPEVIFTDNMTFPYLLRDFGGGGRDTASYRVFDWVTGRIHHVDVQLAGTDTIAAGGAEHACLVFRLRNHDNGVNGTFWVDRGTSWLVRADRSDGVVTYLADAGVRRNIKRIDMDDLILIPVEEDIEDIPDISYMRVRARIRVPGRTITAASLNRPGQSFEARWRTTSWTASSPSSTGPSTVTGRRPSRHRPTTGRSCSVTWSRR